MKRLIRYAKKPFRNSWLKDRTHQPSFIVKYTDRYFTNGDGRAEVRLLPWGNVGPNGKFGYSLTTIESVNIAFYFDYEGEVYGDAFFKPADGMSVDILFDHMPRYKLEEYQSVMGKIHADLEEALINQELKENITSFIAWLESCGWVKYE